MTLRPAWDEVPEWANFLAQDADGSWFAYENEPYNGGFEGMWKSDGRSINVVPAESWNAWRETLKERPITWLYDGKTDTKTILE